MAAVRRWLRVVVLLVVVLWPVLLMIDMALPSVLSAGNGSACKPCTSERAEVRTAPAHRGFVISDVRFTLCWPVSGLTRGAGYRLNLQASPSHAALAQWI
jgi:hypothetical protein